MFGIVVMSILIGYCIGSGIAIVIFKSDWFQKVYRNRMN